MRGLAINFASTHQTENPRGFSEVGGNKQLLIAIVPVAQVKKKTVLIIAVR
ncbi:hypothetical protein GCM10011412_39570 [Maribacter cobaltidurans]|nr:hypothetical protein GCM10011412_39570 [Maribacter cobaltidurans]